MPTAPTHAVAALSLAQLLPRPARQRSLLVAGAMLAVVPDLDVIGFRFGIQYGDLLGHRGLTHGLLFAAVLAGVVTWRLSNPGSGWQTWLYLALATASHGLLDAATDGGLGIAFFSPFETTRYFFPWRPIAVAPIGVAGLLRPTIIPVMASELLWVWLPCLLIVALGRLLYPAAPRPGTDPV